ncbi:MAG: hypothetical protein WBM92_11195 [Aureibaculum sp.]
MKKILLTVTFCFLWSLNFLGQENCSKYYPLEKGTSFQLTMLDNKDKPTGIIDYLVKDYNGNTATLSYEMHDEKGKLITASEYGITCNEQGVSIDFNSLAAPGVMEQYKDMELDISGTDLIIPNNLAIGQTLPDANMLMNVKMSPINIKMNFNIVNRKVEGKESITTSAGIFDCFIISYDHESKMGLKISGSAKQWLAEGIGMVKQESYNKKGKLMGTTLLTKFEK